MRDARVRGACAPKRGARRRLRGLLTVLAVLVFSGTAFAQSTHLLIVVGLPGDPEHGELFNKWGTTLAATATEKLGIAKDRVVLLSDRQATRDGKPVGTGLAHVRTAPDDAEYFDAAMHAPLLKRIAQETGGRFYPADSVASLPEDLKYSGRGVTAVEERELWHMPILLLSLVGVLCAEWGLRRYWRLA